VTWVVHSKRLSPNRIAGLYRIPQQLDPASATQKLATAAAALTITHSPHTLLRPNAATMTLRSNRTHLARNGYLAAAMLLAASIADAQGGSNSLQLSSITTGAPVTVTARCPQEVSVDRIGAGVDATNGILLQGITSGSDVTLHGFSGFSDQQFRALFSANGNTNDMSLPGAMVAADPAKFLVTMVLPRPMRLRITMNAGSVSTTQTPSQTAAIDIGDDGSRELVFASQPGCGSQGRSVAVDLPAGRFVVSMTIALDMPAAIGCRFNRSACVFAELLIDPAHVEITPISQACGGLLDSTPLLDGESVRFWGGPQQLGGFSWIVLGAAETHIPLPATAGCSLLASPDIVVAQPMANYLVLPIARLAPMDLYVQAVVWTPQTPWQPAQLVTSGHSRLRIH
jgi:hypothetical protein